MSTFNADRVEDQAHDLSEYIAKQAQDEAKAFKTKLVVLGVVSLVLVVYFVVMTRVVDTYTEPEKVARETVVYVDDNVPAIVGLLEGAITDATPQIAAFLSEEAIEQGVPLLMRQSEKALDSFVNDLVKETAGFMQQSFDQVITENKATIIEALKTRQTEADAKIAMVPLKKALEETFNSQTGEPTEARISVRKTLVALENLDKRLKALASKDPSEMTQQERKGARLLKTYWSWMRQRTSDDVATHDLPNPKEPIP